MNLHDAHSGIKKNKRRLRIGRGTGSGRGKTSGRGHKGQGQLAGWSAHPVFEGARMPLVRRIPKRGFHNQFGVDIAAINVGDLEAAFNAGDAVDIQSLRKHGLAKGRFDQLKVLGNGDLTKKLTVSAHRFSQSALDKIQKAGGQAVVVPGPKPVAEKKAEQNSAPASAKTAEKKPSKKQSS